MEVLAISVRIQNLNMPISSCLNWKAIDHCRVVDRYEHKISDISIFIFDNDTCTQFEYYCYQYQPKIIKFNRSVISIESRVSTEISESPKFCEISRNVSVSFGQTFREISHNFGSRNFHEISVSFGNFVRSGLWWQFKTKLKISNNLFP